MCDYEVRFTRKLNNEVNFTTTIYFGTRAGTRGWDALLHVDTLMFGVRGSFSLAFSPEQIHHMF